MSMYIRAKRKNQTIFLHVEPSFNFQLIKQKLADILQVDHQQMQLYHSDKRRELLDSATISDQEVKNDDIVYVVFLKETGGWEEIQTDNFALTAPAGEETAY